MPGQLKTVASVDYAVIAAYMLLMLGIGFYAMRFNRGASDYFKGGNRIHWLAAGLSSFMSGFSAWTFTGAAGLAYRQGLVAILLYVGNACTFLLGYCLFAVRWRRARISTVMEYLVYRYDERTRQAFSWTTIFFQLFTGAAMLYGLALFVAPVCGFSLPWAIVGSGVVILAYCVIGGLWAVVITDFLQAAILMPFTIVMCFASLAKVGGLSGLVAALPPELVSLRLPAEYGWGYVLCWTVMVSFGYNTAAMAQRYFSVEDERAAQQDRAALLRAVPGGGLHLVRAAARDARAPPRPQGDLAGAQPTRTSPRTRSRRSRCSRPASSASCSPRCSAPRCRASPGLLNMHALDHLEGHLPDALSAPGRRVGAADGGWTATFAVGVAIIGIALTMAGERSQRVLRDGDLQHRDVARLRPARAARARRAEDAELVRASPRSPWRSCWARTAPSSRHGAVVTNVLIVVPASVAVFFLCRALAGVTDPAHAARRDELFRRLDTPVDVRPRSSATATTPPPRSSAS